MLVLVLHILIQANYQPLSEKYFETFNSRSTYKDFPFNELTCLCRTLANGIISETATMQVFDSFSGYSLVYLVYPVGLANLSYSCDHCANGENEPNKKLRYKGLLP